MKEVNETTTPVSQVEVVSKVRAIKPAELLPNVLSNLDSMECKFHPMIDETIPYRNLKSAESKKKSLHRLIRKLDVKHRTRYQRTPEDTYCNVYSFDYCYFAKVYLPTVWWTDESIAKLQKGEDVQAEFEKTVMPIYSSAIHDWFGTWGESFGWERMTSLTEIQRRVTEEGGVGMICAKRKTVGLSGHIVPIVPETEKKKAFRENGEVLYPLQSQAGKLNYNYFARKRRDWWNHARYSSFVLYYHE
jgi:hypothetical protein